MNYLEVIRYISDIPKFTSKHTTQETKAFLRELLPDISQMKIIHVAGTNGKGSVCAYLRSMLHEMGYSVGSFVSPHLVKLNERISVDEIDISDSDLVRCFDEIFKRLEPSKYHPSYFEFLFFMAMVYFDRKKPDYIILETGLGGRLDATNAIDNKLATIITRIGYDHMAYLGDTIEDISMEKAGIMREGTPVIYDACIKGASEVIKNHAKALNCPAFPVCEQDFSLEKFKNKNIDFSYCSRYYDYIGLTVQTTAFYQMENVSVALRALEVIFGKNEIDLDKIKKAVYETHWVGRMDEIMPEVYIDGAHNVDGIEGFLRSVKEFPAEGRRRLIFGAVSDKEFVKMAKMISESLLFDSVDLVSLDSDRGVDCDELLKCFDDSAFTSLNVHRSVKEALAQVLAKRTETDRIYIAGSLYLVGEVLESIEEERAV